MHHEIHVYHLDGKRIKGEISVEATGESKET